MEHNTYSRHRTTLLSWIHPIILFAIGGVVFVGYIMTHDLETRIVQVLMCYLLASRVKRVHIFYFVILSSSVVFFHLLVPNGRVLWEFWIFRITEGALREGLFRGFTIIGFVFISLWCISPRLTLPTSLGALLSTSVRYFEVLLQSASHKNIKTILFSASSSKTHRSFSKSMGQAIVAQLDSLLTEVVSGMNQSSLRDVPLKTSISSHGTHTLTQKIIGVIFLVSIVWVAFWDFFPIPM